VRSFASVHGRQRRIDKRVERQWPGNRRFVGPVLRWSGKAINSGEPGYSGPFRQDGLSPLLQWREGNRQVDRLLGADVEAF
jgi:hypothetical protein